MVREVILPSNNNGGEGMSKFDINNLQGTATWDRTQEVNPFQELANAVIAQAAKDYFNIAAGFKITPPLAAGEPSPSLREIERFFRSDYFDVITDMLKKRKKVLF